jgi:hypothetical protein
MLPEAQSKRRLFVVGEPPGMSDQGPESLPQFVGGKADMW